MRIEKNIDPSPTAPAKESLEEAAAKKPGIELSGEAAEDLKKAGDDFEKTIEALHARDKQKVHEDTKTEDTGKRANKPGLMKKLLMAAGGALVIIFGLKFFFGKKK